MEISASEQVLLSEKLKGEIFSPKILREKNPQKEQLRIASGDYL